MAGRPSSPPSSPTKRMQQQQQPHRCLSHISAQDKLLLYGLYKQATEGDAPKRSFSLSLAGLAQFKFWRSVSKYVPDDPMEQALEHMEVALSIVKQQLEAQKQVVALHKKKKHGKSTQQKAKARPAPPEMAPLSKKDKKQPPEDTFQETLTPEEMLLLAAAEDDELTIRTLLETEQVVDVNYKDDIGQTALHIAADRGYETVVQLLLEQARDKINVDATDHDGISVLQAAVIGGHYPICKSLLECGADPDKPDQDGDTARLCAMDDGSVTLQNLFESTLPSQYKTDRKKKEKTGPDNLLGDNDDEDDDDDDESQYEECEEDEQSCGTWKTDFPENINQGVVDRVPGQRSTKS